MKSLKKAIEVIEALAKNDSAVGVTLLSKQMKLPKSTVYEILSILKSVRFVEQDPDNKKYHLGLRIFELGTIVQHQLQLRKISYPYLFNLSRQTNETTYLALLEGNKIVYVECVESKARLRAHPIFGERTLLHCTGIGKAILAFLPEDKIYEIIHEGTLERFTENTITDPQMLKLELGKVRKKGYAIDNMEHEEGICCIGAPIRNQRGEVFAAISISGLCQRFNQKKNREMAPLVMQVAQKISAELGYRQVGN
jgi:IclR family KDG regulon transcriptional repressor